MMDAGTIENGISVETKYGTLEGIFEVDAGRSRRIVWTAPAQYVRDGETGGMFRVYVPEDGRSGPASGILVRGRWVRFRSPADPEERERYGRIAAGFAESKVKWLEKKYPEWRRHVSFLSRTGTVPGRFLPYRGSLIRVGYHEERFVKLRGFEEVPVRNDGPSEYREAEGATLYLPSPAARQVPKILVGGREMKLHRYNGPERETAENAEMIRAWYASRELRICETKTREFAAQMGARIRKVGLTWANGLWGKNRLNIPGGRKDGRYESLEIQYYPLCVAFSDYELDALIWHELAHCKETNHQKAFYEELLGWLPDYKERDRALKSADWVKAVPIPGT